jgi:hypothetical protein
MVLGDEIAMQLKHISHSSVTSADECLRKFQLTRLSNPEDRLPSLPAKPRDVGILAHVYIEAWFKDQKFLDKLAEQDHTTHHAEALAIFENWKRRFNIPEDAWLFTEREGSATIEGAPIPLIGYDDFVYVEDGYHVIRDFKTGWGTEVYESYEFQLHLAMLRYEQEFPGVQMKGEIEFVRRGLVTRLQEKVGYDGTKDLVWNDALRAATIARVQAIWQKIKERQDFADNEESQAEAQGYDEYRTSWPATPGSHCTFCDYKTECAVGKRAAAAHLVVTDEASALATLREIVLMDEAMKTMKEALRPYVDAHGTIETGIGKYDYAASYSDAGATESIKDVKGALDILGHDLPKGVLKIDLKLKGAGMLRNDPRITPLIEYKETKPRFTVGKKSEKSDED